MSASAPATGRARRRATVALVVLSCVLALFSAIAVWLKALVLDTDAYVRAIAPVLDHRDVRDELAATIVDELYSHVDVAAALQQSLPQQAKDLAPTLAVSIRTTSAQLASNALATAPVRRVWKEANRLAHGQILHLLEGKNLAVHIAGDEVAIETAPLAAEVRRSLDDAGVRVFDSVPADALSRRFVLFRSDDLTHLQQATRALDALGRLLPILTVLAIAGAVLCSRHRRRTAEQLALGTAAAMVVIVVGVAVGRAYYLHAVGTAIPRVVAAAPFDALVVPLRTGVRVTFTAALGVWFVAWFSASEAAVAREQHARAIATAFVRRHARVLAVFGAVTAGVVLVAWDRPRPLTVAGIVAALTAWEAVCLAATRAREHEAAGSLRS